MIDNFSLKASWIIQATDFAKELVKLHISPKVHYSGQMLLVSKLLNKKYLANAIPDCICQLLFRVFCIFFFSKLV